MEDVVGLWSLWLDPASDEASAQVNLLSPEEAERAARLVFELDRRRYVTSHVFLRRVVAAELGTDPAEVSFTTGPSGKPEIAEPKGTSLRFSLSRSAGRALLVLARGSEVGVDIEECQPVSRVRTHPGRLLSPAESALLDGLADEERTAGFYRLWARKEAAAKAIGSGLHLPLDDLDVFTDHIRGEVGTTWTVRDLDVGPGWSAAVAAQGTWLPEHLAVLEEPGTPG